MRPVLIVLLLALVPVAAAESVVLFDREFTGEQGVLSFQIPHGYATHLSFCYAGRATCDTFGGTPTPLAVRRGLDTCVALPTVSLPPCVLRAKGEDSVAEVTYTSAWPVRLLAIGTR